MVSQSEGTNRAPPERRAGETFRRSSKWPVKSAELEALLRHGFSIDDIAVAYGADPAKVAALLDYYGMRPRKPERQNRR